MTELPASLWNRAQEALRAAKHVLPVSADAAASRAYYAAFYAVSAHFALEGKKFTKHGAVVAAVHRDLVQTGLWPVELGQLFSDLAVARKAGDYGEDTHVSNEEAQRCIRSAKEILRAVAKLRPQEFTGLDEV